MFWSVELLITVKAYPNPSAALGEAACIAGVTRQGQLRRLYPIPYRDLEDSQQFKKYQWISVDTRAAKNDARPETARPILNSIKLIGKPLPTRDGWRGRRDIVKKVQSASMCDIQDAQRTAGTSLGFFRPAEIVDMEAKAEDSPTWKQGELEKLGQQDLFFTKNKQPLEKIPVGFYYRFRCDRCRNTNPHRMKVIDWELAELWRRNRRGYDEATTIALVRRRFMDEMCGPGRDPHFFTGNMAKRQNSFLILGVFWPPKTAQAELF
ncbi:MAG TPA: hypothetical protein VEL28_15395 [Candidatus Binatia bacterium]|nr:hypothetical protein [Candidatus Binatia bacterium]